MTEEYISDEEFRNYYPSLNGLRERIAWDLPGDLGDSVIDVATGYGFFALEIARRFKDLRMVLIDISKPDIDAAFEKITAAQLDDRVDIIRSDATCLCLADASLDAAVNFLGLEDIHMTRGREGVRKVFAEVSRALRPRGLFSFVSMPSDKMETEAQRVEVNVFSSICDATWLGSADYDRMLTEAGFEVLSKEAYRTGKKLTSKQAKAEIEFACSEVPKIYGVKSRDFGSIWKEYGEVIERDGMGHYSKVVLTVARKIRIPSMK
jgi:ubiquinone/menaquinone biosynthesis C-methylase UbiE